MATITVSNTKYHYELGGTGPTLVFISGYATDYARFNSIMPQLQKHFQVLTFDNRGIGETKDDNGTLSAELMADETVKLIQELNLVKPHIIGHSMGGTIAQMLAIRHPQHINKLGIFNSTSKWRQAMLNGLRSTLLMRKENTSFDTQFMSICAWIYGENFLQNHKEIARVKELTLNNPNPQSIFDQERQFNVLETFNALDHLHKIQHPTLVLYGTEDLLSIPTESELLANSIKNSKLVKLDCGHVPFDEMPTDTLNAIVNFFKS